RLHYVPYFVLLSSCLSFFFTDPSTTDIYTLSLHDALPISLVASLLSLVPGTERILCIEEATELAPTHPHVLHLQVRRANVQGAGEIDLAQLVRTAMRMRQERVVLGQRRGAEVREGLAAVNTGND